MHVNDQEVEKRDESDAFIKLWDGLKPLCRAVEPDGEETADCENAGGDDYSNNLLLLSSAFEVLEVEEGEAEG